MVAVSKTVAYSTATPPIALVVSSEQVSGFQMLERGEAHVSMKAFSLVQQLPSGMAAQLVSKQSFPF